LNVDPIMDMFRVIVRPIAESVHRYLGVNDPVNDPQNILRNTTYTVAADAFAAMNTVMYRKAARLSPGHVLVFAGNPRGDKFQALNLITLFASSIGPIERERDPYRCTFIPYYTRAEIDAVTAHAHYNERLAKQFYMNVAKSYTQVELTTIDPYNDVTSPWWTLYPTTDDDNRTVFCPINFNDHDHAVTLASVLIDTQAYPLPGPIHTATVYFVAQNNDQMTRNDIPPPLATDLSINESPPVVHILFERIRDASNAEIIGFGVHQNDATLRGTPHMSIRNPNQWMAHQIVPYDALIDHLEQSVAHVSQIANMNDAQKGAIDPANPPPGWINDPGHAPPRPATPVGHTQDAVHINIGVYRATVMYFDHVIVSSFPVSRRNAIITESVTPGGRN
jgi:hypothetical protein